MSHFELPPQRLIVLRLTPGIPEGQPMIIGGVHEITPEVPTSFEATLAAHLVKTVYGMEFADNLPAPVEPEPELPLEEKLSKRKGNCKTC